MKMASALAAVCTIAMAGCVSNISPSTYSVGAVGQVNRTVAARVISARDVDIAGTGALGSAAGAGAGAAAGSAFGGGTRSNIVGAIGGAVIGGLVGAAAEQAATKQRGMEYVVETENGNLMTMVQGNDNVFSVDQKVLVLYGTPSRLVPDPR